VTFLWYSFIVRQQRITRDNYNILLKSKMDLCTVVRRSLSLVLVLSVAFSLVVGAPAQQSHGSSAGNSLSLLRESIMELENVVYKLKDFFKQLQSADNARDAAMLGDAEPEFDLSDLQRLAAAAKSRHSAGSAAGQKTRPSSVDQSASDVDSISDNSMKEALEYLMNLANEKKQDKRDHDIPFPLMDREGQ